MTLSFLKKAGAAGAACEIPGLEGVFRYGIMVIKVIQIAAPIALIIWGSIDLLKAVIAKDDKKISEARKPFIQRLISAVLIFLIPWITNLVITSFIKDDSSGGWIKCYKAASTAQNDKISTDPSKF